MNYHNIETNVSFSLCIPKNDNIITGIGTWSVIINIDPMTRQSVLYMKINYKVTFSGKKIVKYHNIETNVSFSLITKNNNFKPNLNSQYKSYLLEIVF